MGSGWFCGLKVRARQRERKGTEGEESAGIQMCLGEGDCGCMELETL